MTLNSDAHITRHLVPFFRMALEDLPGSVIEFKREVYSAVVADFVPLIKKLKDSGQLNVKP